jgi:hypothetical protein
MDPNKKKSDSDPTIIGDGKNVSRVITHKRTFISMVHLHEKRIADISFTTCVEFVSEYGKKIGSEYEKYFFGSATLQTGTVLLIKEHQHGLTLGCLQNSVNTEFCTYFYFRSFRMLYGIRENSAEL